MTRVTAPISKLTGSLTANPTLPRPTFISKTSKAVAASLARAELHSNGRNSEHPDLSYRRSITTTHRPTPQPVPSRSRTIPLMQTFNFQTSAPSRAQLDTSTIDFAAMPSSASLYPVPSDDPFARLRVPLLPDNFMPDRTKMEGHTPEAQDAPLAAPEINVLAAHPENVVPSALTEVEGMGIDGIELNFVHDVHSAAPEREPGMLTDVWKGLLDDVFGGEKKRPAF